MKENKTLKKYVSPLNRYTAATVSATAVILCAKSSPPSSLLGSQRESRPRTHCWATQLWAGHEHGIIFFESAQLVLSRISLGRRLLTGDTGETIPVTFSSSFFLFLAPVRTDYVRRTTYSEYDMRLSYCCTGIRADFGCVYLVKAHVAMSPNGSPYLLVGRPI